MNKPLRHKQCDPEDYDNEDDFMAACTADGMDEDYCQGLWDSEGMSASGDSKVIRKTHTTADVVGMDFVLSDETVDRYGDVIASDGWDVKDFKKNPIALFGHRGDFPIGTWDNLRVENKGLRARLKLAPEGTSARIDEIRKLVDAGILKAVSVGFMPVESKPLESGGGGYHYTKSSLMECSLVTIPANPNALQIAKALKISDETQKLVFAGSGARGQLPAVRRASNGGSAENPPVRKNKTMINVPIAQRVKDAETKRNELRDKLTEHIKTVDDANITEEQETTTNELTNAIEAADRSLESLKKVEKTLAFNSKPVSGAANGAADDAGGQGLPVRHETPFAMPKQKIRPSDYIWKALTAQIRRRYDPAYDGLSPTQSVQKCYGGQERMHDSIVALSGMLTRGASTVGTTTTATWAAELVTVSIGDFFDLLQPTSIYARLSALGGRFTFGQSGVVSMPYRTNTKLVAGAFVAQGGAIPVKQASFNALNLTPKKMAVISTFTRELAEHSTPSIEALIREAIVDDTATAVDAILMDTNAATTTRPAGLGYNLSTQTPGSAGTGLPDVVNDLKVMSNALSTASNGNIRTPVWIMTPGQANCIGLAIVAASGIMPFRDEILAGRWNGWPIIMSTSTIPSDTIWLMDANDFVTATGDTPRFEVSDSATLMMEDAAASATDIVVGGVVNAGTVKSLWQTDSIGIRMIMDMNWAMRRSGMVLFMTNIAWSP
jgi:HK97 family phage prohead protease/HK97 family phage major capsid protein